MNELKKVKRSYISILQARRNH